MGKRKKKVEELTNISRGLDPSNKRACVKQKTHRSSWKVVQASVLQSKIPSSSPCQPHLEENSLGAHMGNDFTCQHSAYNNLKSFSSSTLFLMYIFCVWWVWTGLWLTPALQGGESGTSQSRGAGWLKVATRALWCVLTLPSAWKYERYFIFQHISVYLISGMVFKSLSTFYLSADKHSLLWVRTKHEQPTSKSCIET